MTITLYDSRTMLPSKSASPWVAKVRMVLNYKGIEHRTILLWPSEIQLRSHSLGLPTNDFHTAPDGGPKYTVPSIYDPTTNTSVTDSLKIIQYLDDAYPDTPGVIPKESLVAHIAFESTIFQTLSPNLIPVIGPRLIPFLEAPLAAKYKANLENIVGTTFEDFVFDPTRADGYWEKVKSGFDTVDGYFAKAEAVRTDVEGPFMGGGKVPLYADFSLGALLIWVVRALGEDDDRWRELRGWNDGRWSRIYDSLNRYTTLHE